MKLHESVQIAAPPESVWPFVAEPVLMSTWNPKIVAVERQGNEPVHLGEQFAMIYRMSNRDRESRVEVTACEPPLLVEYRHRTASAGPEGFALERYELEPRDGGTRLSMTIELGTAGIPFLFRVLIWVIHRIGKPQSKPYLADLKQKIEELGRQESGYPLHRRGNDTRIQSSK